MLTVQPNFTPRSNKVLSFKSGYTVNSEEDKKFQSKTAFYEQQAQEFDEMIQNKQTPDYMKKIFKGFKVVSEALFEGWLVMWGASKGSKFAKEGIIKGANSKFGQEFKNILKPISKGFVSAKSAIGKSISEGADRFKNSEFLKKMNNNEFGKQVIKVFELIGKGISTVGKAIKAGFEVITKPFKGKSASEIYDKTAKATGTTLGVGAGAAGAYNAATRPDDTKAAQKTREADDIYNDLDDSEDYQYNYDSDNGEVNLDKEFQEVIEDMEKDGE